MKSTSNGFGTRRRRPAPKEEEPSLPRDMPRPCPPPRLPARLCGKQLSVGSLLVLAVAGLGMLCIGQWELAKDLCLACLRATTQLFLLGGLILQKLLGTTQPAVVWTWIIGVGILAAQEALSRVEYTYPHLGRHLTISVLSSGVGVLAVTIVGGVFGELEPWFQPKTLIPTAGMLFGNTLTAISLGASSLTRHFAESAAETELRLAWGATAHEAVRPMVRTSLTTALTPTINSLSATGIVHMPGMMTGQVLSGQNPSQAAAYQVLILFLITSTACATVQMLTHFITHELVDMKGMRLQTTHLVRNRNAKKFSLKFPLQSLQYLLTSWVEPLTDPIPESESISPELRFPTVVSLRNTPEEHSHPVLKVSNLLVTRSNMEVSFHLAKSDRLCITGTTGIGKTQLLRTLSGLEHVQGSMELEGVPHRNQKWPAWRRDVCWVPQDRTTVDGTPRDLFQQVRSFSSQKEKKSKYPEDIASIWGLVDSAFERPWSTLSGGEAQRASLAIALSFQPKVLLLDEITAGLDEETQLAVEETLVASGIPLIMVTHSPAQLARFCTHHMDLNQAATIRK